jgi:hypothetical protein
VHGGTDCDQSDESVKGALNAADSRTHVVTSDLLVRRLLVREVEVTALE